MHRPPKWLQMFPQVERRLLAELKQEQVTIWSREQIQAHWPEGYDLSKVDRKSGDEGLIRMSIKGFRPDII